MQHSPFPSYGQAVLHRLYPLSGMLSRTFCTISKHASSLPTQTLLHSLLQKIVSNNTDWALELVIFIRLVTQKIPELNLSEPPKLPPKCFSIDAVISLDHHLLFGVITTEHTSWWPKPGRSPSFFRCGELKGNCIIGCLENCQNAPTMPLKAHNPLAVNFQWEESVASC